MNLNDYRLKAYSKAKDSGEDAAKAKENSQSAEGRIRKPVFEKVNRQVGDLFAKIEQENTRSNAPAEESVRTKSITSFTQATKEAPSREEKKRIQRGKKYIPENTGDDEKTKSEARIAAKTGTYFSKKTTTDQDVKAAASKLTTGGLIKVPAQEKKPGEAESIYRRVAKFLVVIGVDEAAKILPHLTEEQTEKIIPEIASIRSVPQEEAQEVLKEFEGLITKAREEGGIDTARTILTKAYGSEKAEDMLQKAVKYPDGKPFDYLEDATPERIAVLIGGESGAVKALVLSQLEPQKAAKIINGMDDNDKKDVVLRLARMKPVSPAVMEQINKSLHEKMLTQNTENSQNMDGRGVLAQILKRMDPGAESTIIGTLSEQDPDLGADLRRLLFTEEDVINADDRFLQKKLHDMENKDIAVLLRKKSNDFRWKILRNVSKHRSEAILDEESLLGQVLKSDYERITSQFYADLRRAWERGDLIVKGRDDGEIYV